MQTIHQVKNKMKQFKMLTIFVVLYLCLTKITVIFYRIQVTVRQPVLPLMLMLSLRKGKLVMTSRFKNQNQKNHQLPQSCKSFLLWSRNIRYIWNCTNVELKHMKDSGSLGILIMCLYWVLFIAANWPHSYCWNGVVMNI